MQPDLKTPNLGAPRATAPVSMMEGERLVNSRQVRDFFGGVSDMWIFRRVRDPQLQFPQPIVIAGRNYWRAAELRAWIANLPKRAA